MEGRKSKSTNRESVNGSDDKLLDLGDQWPILKKIITVYIRESFVFHLFNVRASYDTTNRLPQT